MSKQGTDAMIKQRESQIHTNRNLEPKPPIENSTQINTMDIEMTLTSAYKISDIVATWKARGLAPLSWAVQMIESLCWTVTPKTPISLR